MRFIFWMIYAEQLWRRLSVGLKCLLEGLIWVRVPWLEFVYSLCLPQFQMSRTLVRLIWNIWILCVSKQWPIWFFSLLSRLKFSWMARGSSTRNQKVTFFQVLLRRIERYIDTEIYMYMWTLVRRWGIKDLRSCLHRFGEEMRPVKLTTKVFGMPVLCCDQLRKSFNPLIIQVGEWKIFILWSNCMVLGISHTGYFVVKIQSS